MYRSMSLAAFLMLTACVQAPTRTPPSPEQTAAVDDAIRAEIDCGRRFIAQIDDRTSDATTIALALALRCNAEYNAATESVAIGLDNDVQRRMLRQRRSGREERIESFLPIVMQYRHTTKVK